MEQGMNGHARYGTYHCLSYGREHLSASTRNDLNFYPALKLCHCITREILGWRLVDGISTPFVREFCWAKHQ
eukprot:5345688-Amphidinium_carterae.1